MVLAWSIAPLSAQSPDPSTQPRLAFSDFSYVGGFRLPAESSNGDSFSFGGRQLTFNPVRNSLFVGSREGRIAEVSIPAPVNTNNPAAMPFATYLQGFADPTEGRLSEIASSGVNLDGLMVYNNRLYGSASIFYDANNTQRVSHYSRSLNLNEASFSGWSQVWETGRSGFVSGMMSLIPAEWRETLGGPAATGQCCIPIVMRTSWGPAAFAFDPAQIGQAAVPATPLLYYPNDHPTLGPWDGASPTYGATISMGGMALIGGTRTALYIGRNGLGPNCYGNGTSDQSLHGTTGPDGAHWCYDPTSTDKGSHAYPYRYQIWAYDLADFAAVRAGIRQPWEVVPYGVWPFDLPTPEASVRIGGIGYDAANQLLYVSQIFADRDGYSNRPVIHVIRINAAPGSTEPGLSEIPPPPQPAPAPPAAPTGSSTVVSAITLSVNRVAPQLAGTPITFTAFAIGGVQPQEYKWLVDDGSGLRAVTAWSVLDSFTWTPSTANAGYRVGVWARSNGNTVDAPEASASTAFAITAPTAPAATPVSWVTIAADRTAPQAAGTAVRWTATIGGGSAVEYKWLLHDGGAWAAVTGWSSSNTFTWTPTTANPNYRVGIWVRSNGNTSENPEVTSSTDFPISAAAAAVVVNVSANWLYPGVNTSDVSLTTPLQWTAVSGAQAYYLWIGSSPGTSDLVDTGEIQQLQYLASNLPAATTVYATIFTKYNDTWWPNAKTFTTSPAQWVTPAVPGADLPSGTALQWAPVNGAQAYYVSVGTALDGRDVSDTGEIQVTQLSTSGMPTGQLLYANIYVKYANQWYPTRTTFTLVPTGASWVSVSGPTLPAGQPLQWTTVPEAQAYYLWIGTSPMTKNIVDTGEIQSTTYPSTSLPSNTLLHATIFTKLNGIWTRSSTVFTIP